MPTFDYDNRNRMTGLTNNRPGGIISQYVYTLDGAGNRTNVSFQEPLSWVPSMVGVDYSYLPGNFLTSAGATTYSYDLNGNLYTRTQGGNTTTYTFDSQDRLTNISSPSLNIQYQYDGLFNRISKTVTATTTKYLVDPNGFLPQVIAEMDGAYNITSYYVYDGIGLVAKMTPSGSSYFYHYNGSGNTIAMTDSSGNMVNKYAYDEFGNLVNVEESVPNPFLFVGQYGVMDDDNGLLYMRARYYDPQVGRFINKDPISYLGGLNLFIYVGNDPVDFIDPLGLLGWADMPTIPQPVSDVFAGFGDTLTSGFGLTSLFGLPSGTEAIRGLWEVPFDLPNTVDSCSKSYKAGEYAAYVWGVALGGAIAGSYLEVEVNAFSKGNVFKFISKKLRLGFRIDRAKHGPWGHRHYWKW